MERERTVTHVCDREVEKVVGRLIEALQAIPDTGQLIVLLLGELSFEITRMNGSLERLDASTFRTMRDALQRVQRAAAQLPDRERAGVLFETNLIQQRLQSCPVEVPGSLVV